VPVVLCKKMDATNCLVYLLVFKRLCLFVQNIGEGGQGMAIQMPKRGRARANACACLDVRYALSKMHNNYAISCVLLGIVPWLVCRSVPAWPGILRCMQ
jgi:hypothetical protein